MINPSSTESEDPAAKHELARSLPAFLDQVSQRKYTLNPGYQLCYTLGLHQFLGLLERYGRDNLPNFVQTVLPQGEIHFTDLEKILQKYQRLILL